MRTAQFRVDDLDAARDWYAGFLGVDPYFDEPFYVGFEVAGYEFGLMPGTASSDGALFLWGAEEPQAHFDRALEMGATPGMDLTDTGDGIAVGTFIDPFGNEFGLIRNPHFAAPLTHAEADDISTNRIEFRAHVPVSAQQAWDLWATSEGLAKWWTPNTRVDLRPGGHYEIFFNPDEPPGDKGGDWCRVLSLFPGRMLSFTWNAPPNLKTRPDQTWVVLFFEDDADGCTVTLDHFGWPESGLARAESDWPATFEYFETAWRYVMGLFEGHCGGT
ncbi:MAG: SRPBCC domain-containing protein [Acidimicrobiia bacterium]